MSTPKHSTAPQDDAEPGGLGLPEHQEDGAGAAGPVRSTPGHWRGLVLALAESPVSPGRSASETGWQTELRRKAREEKDRGLCVGRDVVLERVGGRPPRQGHR